MDELRGLLGTIHAVSSVLLGYMDNAEGFTEKFKPRDSVVKIYDAAERGILLFDPYLTALKSAQNHAAKDCHALGAVCEALGPMYMNDLESSAADHVKQLKAACRDLIAMLKDPEVGNIFAFAAIHNFHFSIEKSNANEQRIEEILAMIGPT